MVTAALLVFLAVGYVAGRLDGRARARAFLADGFHYLSRLSEHRGQHMVTRHEPAMSADDISAAFGSAPRKDIA